MQTAHYILAICFISDTAKKMFYRFRNISVHIPIFIYALFIITLLPAKASAEYNNIKFQSLPSQAGLSQSSILCMLQDSVGFIWFGTYDGLNRYDGFQMKVYTNQGKDSHLPDNNIRSLYEDSAGILWVGTKSGGLNRYNRSLDNFTTYVPDKSDPDSISGLYVQCIYEDTRGNLWVGTDKGLNTFSRETKKFRKFRHDKDDPESINSDDIRSICEDNQGRLWVGTSNGINRFDYNSKKFISFTDKNGSSNQGDHAILDFFCSEETIWVGTENSLKSFDPVEGKFKTHLKDLEINNIYRDKSGKIWLATSKGLAYPAKSGQHTQLTENCEFEFIRNVPSDPFSLISDQVTRVMEDSSGVFWIGTYTDGVCKVTPKMKNFKLLQHLNGVDNSLSGKEISAVLEDNEGLVWIGTYTNGINVFNSKTGIISSINTSSKGKWKIPSDSINCLFQDSHNKIWVGTRDKGIFILDKQKGLISSLKNDPDDESTLSHNIIWCLYEGSQGYIWAGTSKKGLNRITPETGEIRHYRHDESDPDSIAHDRVRHIFEDSHGNFWISTNGGLDLMNRASGKFIHHKHDPDDPQSISENRVTPIAEGSDGTLWVGTDGGINHFFPEKGKFKRYTRADGLNNEVIQGLLLDKEGFVWASTFNGLIKLDPSTDKIINFGTYDGLQGAEFWVNAYHKGASGRMYFGGLKGLTYFSPEKIRSDTAIPPVVITGVSIMNKPLDLESNIVNTPEITLSYKDTMFSISFAALDFQNPGHNRYKYKLEGFDKQWIDASSDHKATYTNFDQGNYVFRVIASNSDGIWNEKGASLKIIITPPFWKTWWFYSLAVLILILSILIYIRLRVRAITIQKKNLSKLVRNRTEDLKKEIEDHRKTEVELEEAIKKAEEANQAKSSFLANMSHEIRTPLNSIIGMADLLKDTDLNSEQKEYVGIFKSSGEILLSIINDILDFSKIEAGFIKLEKIPIDLFQEVEAVMTLQSVSSLSRQVELICRFSPEVPEFVIGDPTRLRQILLNIISNATKFTTEGEVSLSLTREPTAKNIDMLRFTIKDTGIGIEQSKLDSIFAPFSQATSSTTRKFGGSGLGLSISKSLAELMGGSISAESTPGKGSSFIIDLPMKRDQDSESLMRPDFSDKIILIAVNNGTLMDTLTEITEYFGATVIQAPSLMELKPELEISRRDEIDALVIDHNFDDSDSLSIIESYGRRNKLPKTILLTRGLISSKRMEGIAHLIQGICPKPVSRKLLLKQLTAIFTNEKDITDNESEKYFSLPELKILVADDNIPSRELIRHFLKSFGVTLVMSSDGREALKLAVQDHFDIVLIDMEIPEINGYDFLKRLRSEEKENHKDRLAVIAFSTFPASECREKSIDAGADAFLSKPVNKEHLLKEIKKISDSIK